MTRRGKDVLRALFALISAGVLVVTFYFPLIGLGYALDSSADLQSRGEGLLLLLPSLAIATLLGGMLPPVRGRLLLWIGTCGSLLLLPPIAAGVWIGLPETLGALAGCLYLAIWWRLAWSKLASVTTRDSGVQSR